MKNSHRSTCSPASKMKRIKTYYCRFCGVSFESDHLMGQAYCSRSCEGKAYRNRHGLRKLKDGRFCKQCGVKFYPVQGENNKQHCSDECSKKSARESRTVFWKKQANPHHKMKEYHRKSRERLGPDSNLKRFYRNNPDAPHECESCGEHRVLDIAHKPGFERNGSWRSVGNTLWPKKTWVLCPTCHALLDRMNYAPQELGLTVGGGAICQKIN